MDMSAIVETKRNPNIPALASGDTVKVHVKVKEGDRERVQVFQGVVIRIKRGKTGNFTVRRVAYGIGTERTFPVNSPMIDKVEVTRHGKVRRARLFYLRGLTSKKARLKERRVLIEPEAPAEPETTMTVEEAPAAAEATAPMATPAEVSEQPEAVAPEAPKAETPEADAPKDEAAPPEPETEQKTQ
ncbi:MAG: 50S ribosomal protein L19 [Dehalococcoidales bacterium]|nr:50S ribosomal protein L19 [Dehalococcoidales bacterium]